MAVDESGRELTFAGYRDAVPAHGRLAWQSSESAPTRPSPGMLPTWFESMVLCLALSRLGAIQNPIIPIYRKREVGFIAKAGAADAPDHTGAVAGLRLRGDGEGDRQRDRMACRRWW